ncbi:hypothetical protein HCJ33_10395 [Listeria seeligeri]|nr:hypothetical protein [Listeria seeligeri]
MMSTDQISYSSERIRKMLQDVIQKAYETKESSETLTKMKRFWFYFQAKEGKINGYYQSDIFRIRIQNFSRPAGHVLVTCIHEVAHHVDFIIRNETKHDATFYQVFYNLLVVAMGMGLLSKEQLLAIQDTNCVEKLEKHHGLIKYWIISPDNSYQDFVWIKCRSSILKKERVKKANYQFCSFEKVWYKQVPKKQMQVELDYLARYYKKSEYCAESIFNFSFSVVYYVSLRNGRIHKEELKKIGYFYEAYDLGAFTWNKILLASQWPAEKAKLEKMKGLKVRILLK